MKQDTVQKISLERIFRLFELAEKEFSKHSKRSNRYVEIGLKISQRNKTSIPKELKKKYCKKCHFFLKKGKNSEWAEKEKWIEIKCRECGFTAKRRIG